MFLLLKFVFILIILSHSPQIEEEAFVDTPTLQESYLGVWPAFPRNDGGDGDGGGGGGDSAAELDPAVQSVLASVRDLLTLLWLLHARDKLSLALRVKLRLAVKMVSDWLVVASKVCRSDSGDQAIDIPCSAAWWWRCAARSVVCARAEHVAVGDTAASLLTLSALSRCAQRYLQRRALSHRRTPAHD